jgi:hypothetical protein
VLTARITLRVQKTGPVELRFPTAQRFDLVLRDPQWRALYQWSDGRVFAQVLGAERVGPAG